MLRKYGLLLVIVSLFSFLLFSCTNKLDTKMGGRVESLRFTLSVPELSDKVSPSLKAGFYEELKISKFRVIIENATIRIEKDVHVFERKELQYTFELPFSGTEVLEPGIYDITIEAYPEKVGRFSNVNVPIMKRKLANYLLTAGNPHELKVGGSNVIKLEWEKSGNVTIVVEFDDSVDLGGSYVVQTASVSGISGMSSTISGRTVVFTKQGIAPGVYNVTVNLKIYSNGTEVFDTRHYRNVPVSITVYPVVDSFAAVRFGTENNADVTVRKLIGVELKKADLESLPSLSGIVTTTPAVVDSYLFVTTTNGLYVYEKEDNIWKLRVFTPLAFAYITSPIVEKDESDPNVYWIYFGANSDKGRVFKYKFRYVPAPVPVYSLSEEARYEMPIEDGAQLFLVEGSELAMIENFVLYVDRRLVGTQNRYAFRALKKADLQNAGAFQQLGTSKPTSPIGIGISGFVATEDGRIWRIKFVTGNIVYSNMALGSGNTAVNGPMRNLAFIDGSIFVVANNGRIGKVSDPENNWTYSFVGRVTSQGLSSTATVDVVDVTSDPVICGNEIIMAVRYTANNKYYLWSSTKGNLFETVQPIVASALVTNKGKFYAVTNNTPGIDFNFLYEIDLEDAYVYRVWRLTQNFRSSLTLYGTSIIALSENGSVATMPVDTGVLATGWTKYRGSLNNSARR